MLFPTEQKVNTFGECLLVNDLSDKKLGTFILKDIYFGLRNGEALAVSGLKAHGRVALCNTLSGFMLPSDGDSIAVSKYSLRKDPHRVSLVIKCIYSFL